MWYLTGEIIFVENYYHKTNTEKNDAISHHFERCADRTQWNDNAKIALKSFKLFPQKLQCSTSFSKTIVFTEHFQKF